jgi:pimeloyl-ACP methyl ester carboxylesterase
MPSTVCFSHGKESGPWGTKIQRLAEEARQLGWPVESLDYRGLEVGDRETLLANWCEAQSRPPVLVGSSLGAHVALTQADRARALFLIAPAVYMAGYEWATPAPPAVPVTVVHGWQDEIVPVDNALRFAREANCSLHVLPGDHRLIARLDTLAGLFRQFLMTLAA